MCGRFTLTHREARALAAELGVSVDDLLGYRPRAIVAPIKPDNGSSLGKPQIRRLSLRNFPFQLSVARARGVSDHVRLPAADCPVGDAHSIAGLGVLNARLHHSLPSRTAHTRTGSPTPFSDCSPRSSNVTQTTSGPTCGRRPTPAPRPAPTAR